jgi:hypothetical protein
MLKLIILSLRARKQITSTTFVWTILIQAKLHKIKNRENLAPTKNSKKSTNLLMRKLDLFLLDSRRSLFKTNKTRNTAIKKSSDQSGGNDGHWASVDIWWSKWRRWVVQQLEGRTKVAGGFAYGQKTPKNTKKTREKHVKNEGKIRKGGEEEGAL